MRADSFIAGKLRFKGKMALVATSISSFVMIVAVAVSGGFRNEIRNTISEMSADILVCNRSLSPTGEDKPVVADSCFLEELRAVDGVRSVTPVICKAGVAKTESELDGVLFKSTPDMEGLDVRIPSRLASRLSLNEGDKLLSYFMGERVRARKFLIKDIYDCPVELGGTMLVMCSESSLRQLSGWEGDECSSIEVRLDKRWNSASAQRFKNQEIGMISLSRGYYSTAASDRYRSLFDWLSLIDANVVAILVLMCVVAGFNMISALLILLMRSVRTIGMLKSMGMSDRGVKKVYLRLSGRQVALGLLIGNALAGAFCLFEAATHAIKLNPANYFVSYVPVHIGVPVVIAVDILAWLAIMGILLLGTRYISKIDPALSTKAD